MTDQPTPTVDPTEYETFRLGVQAAFDGGAGPLFQTDAAGLFETYLAALPGHRQHHDCTACRRFVERFGGLVRVSDTGAAIPAMWREHPVPDFYRPAAAALHAKVKAARIVRPFLTAQPVLGRPQTGEWHHLAIRGAPVFRQILLKPHQVAAGKLQDFRTVAAALEDFTAPMLDEALRLLKADHLHRAERFTAPVQWLRALHRRPKGPAGDNLLWRAVATAPDGFCHPRASVIGSLLEDLAAGLPFDALAARFDAKVAPLAYQRPKAAPAAGAIAAAEAMVATMGLAPALDRRFARLDDCVTVWTPAQAPKPGGVFGHLTPKPTRKTPQVDAPELTLTWVKFLATVVPDAQAIQLLVPAHGHFVALLTAADPDAPPILKWDRSDRRSPVSWYVYSGGSDAAQWRLTPDWTEITAIIPSPATWGETPKAYLGEGFVLALKGAVDTRTNSGNAPFPEFMRGELHAVRSVIEAYSRKAQIAGRDEASACGYAVNKGEIGIVLRVVTDGRSQDYIIDRWD